MSKVEEIIKNLALEPHPEGGYFKETYRSKGEITQDCLSPNYKGKRNHSTCIYFMLTSDTFSAFHKINQDEIWHFYDGAPILLHTLSETGIHNEFIIGRNLSKGQTPQLVVPGGHWFAAKVLTEAVNETANEAINEKDYSLVGCTVSPGFDFNDFVLPSRAELIELFPQHEKLIVEFT